MFRRHIYTDPGSEQLGSVLVLGDEVVQVGPLQSFGTKQYCSSKHLDRTSTGPGSEQIRRLNSLLNRFIDKYLLITNMIQARNRTYME